MARLKGRQRVVCGVDEAGRGPWAGPVVAAAVVLDPHNPIDGLDDSKRLTQKVRERLFDDIVARAHVCVALAGCARIEAMNIRGASLFAMASAINGLAVPLDLALIDGNAIPNGLAVEAEAIVRGDQRCAAISAASIVAKVTRDRLMVRLAQSAPGYGFEAHKGYGTLRHREALEALGPSPHHRRSFKPVRDVLERLASARR
ncbi:MAG: ribonuclease HII [Pseudomonadota bacterium]